MPNGYRKHKKHIGRKAARGGGSGSSKTLPLFKRNDSGDRLKPPPRATAHRIYSCDFNDDSDDCQLRFDGFDEESEAMQVDTCSEVRPQHIGDCAVCYDHGALIQLMKNCDHPAACHSCLREIYVNQAQQDVKNYPLKCFHPACNRIVPESQLTSHGILGTNKEKERHFRLATLAKSYGQSRTVVLHCPHCDHPRKYVKPHGDQKLHVFRCMACSGAFAHDNTGFLQTLEAIESFEDDEFGDNDGWAHCPACGILINKGNGCFHMTCICGQEFFWDEAQEREKRRTKQYALSKTVVES